jgi:hypothetical protein
MSDDSSSGSTRPRVGVVGPCKSGKSTLARGLQQAGYEAVQIAQEHSFSPRMWQVIAKPDVLVFLDSRYETTLQRGLRWTRAEYDEQAPRLANARANADLVLDTDDVEPGEILQRVVDLLLARLGRR